MKTLFQKGQATVETGLVLPLLLIMVLGYGGGMILFEAIHELNAATDLAAAVEATTPARTPGPTYTSAQATSTFNGTIHQYPYLDNVGISCSDTGAPGNITCTGQALLRFDKLPFGAVWKINMQLSSTAYSYRSQYRSQ
jgi:hypothetical protein